MNANCTFVHMNRGLWFYVASFLEGPQQGAVALGVDQSGAPICLQSHLENLGGLPGH